MWVGFRADEMGNEALPRYGQVRDLAAAVREVGIPDQNIALLRHERLFVKSISRRIFVHARQETCVILRRVCHPFMLATEGPATWRPNASVCPRPETYAVSLGMACSDQGLERLRSFLKDCR